MSKLYFTIIFNLLFGFSLAGQDIDQTLKMAGHYRELGSYEQAAGAYRRAIFFGNDSIQNATYPLIAECQLQAGQYAESIFFYGLASNTTHSDSLRNEYAFMRVLASLMQDDSSLALQNLYSVNHGGSGYFFKKYHFYHGIVSLSRHDIDVAHNHFLESAGSPDERLRIDSLFRTARLHHPDPLKARRLSYVLPGLGQAYAGDARAALNSFALNAGLGTLAVYTALNYSFWEGAISIVPWLIRYYLGGLRNAETTAIRIRKEKRQSLLQEILKNKYE